MDACPGEAVVASVYVSWVEVGCLEQRLQEVLDLVCGLQGPTNLGSSVGSSCDHGRVMLHF